MIDKENIIQEEEERELFENYRIEVDKGQGLLRIDKFLMDRLENTSRNKIQQAAKAECIRVNDKVVKSNYKVHPNDIIQIFLPSQPREIEIIPQDIPLNIVYEDKDVIIVDKASEMVVHPGYGNYSGTLLNALTFHFLDQKDEEGNPVRPLLVHRIDKNTTGLLLIAKNEFAQSFLAKQFYDHSVDRTYTAIVWGDIEQEKGTIQGNIGRSLKDRKVMQVFPDGDYGKWAITHYEVLFRYGYVTLIQCNLETGRTHQIRTHLKHIGHPLFNDETYGGNQIIKGTTYSKYKQFIQNCFKIIPRQALHATTLGFIHPKTKEKLFFSSSLPEDMLELKQKWEQYINYNKIAEE
ncbi:MAG: RluA family pseudouridine synthase [Bacteroidales bacterium]|jgi:23S rRNA pseudouridine1911/1915/1917 synthase|nr:RluA family pseudouridine synthase [Bacteroidales bacterium]